ncbi:DUF3866 family protein [Alkaliphilus peptidifermentans]|uniref:DUF3866 domain-containing protein n=1 Tax=Alkaliphilus peptidifermentans DSM 18978 TaxID=1120976 RepID=A0A1G5KFS7_9FIRM|nr:DUF3866 family protein [Alkaliphilus peptidifermentans]SCY98938.1 Protein of unknown function [Alkaliphilus peptidifermentans DSM 18978]
MISLRRGYVKKIIHQTIDKSEVIVEINGALEKAINYNHLSGEIAVGDLVIMNITAVELGLGTGGYHFIIANLRHESIKSGGKGHIMKLRYTPIQIKVLAAEEQNSPYHELFLNFESLNGLPVLIGSLHSMLLPMAATIKYYRPKAKIAYIMTDGAALPIYLSKTVDLLKEKKLIDATITIGNAFGGDFECINVYNGLIAAKEIIKCDFAIITMGPGIVGSGTPFGFSGIEQGINIDAVNSLGGKAITIPRISFADERERHKGISHHTLTVLNKIAKTKSYLPLPLLGKTKMDYLHNQINNLKIDKKHYIVEVNASILPTILDKYSIRVNSMGREFNDDPAFFLACCSGARYSLEALK